MDNQLPKISSYGNYSSSNYGVNSLELDFENFTVYYSYETIVAFKDVQGLVVSQNRWGVTTGKHLNWIDGGDKKSRLPADQFDAKLTAFLARHTQMYVLRAS